jgi:hypothetical protein
LAHGHVDGEIEMIWEIAELEDTYSAVPEQRGVGVMSLHFHCLLASFFGA